MKKILISSQPLSIPDSLIKLMLKARNKQTINGPRGMGLEGCGKEGQQGGDGSDGKELVAMQETRFNPWVRKIPL